MFNKQEQEVINQIRIIEDQQRSTMIEINNILRSIPDLLVEGEEQNFELKNANNRMKSLINQRLQLMNSIGIKADGPLPSNIEKHLLDNS
jgi:hypothetical protein